MSERTTYTIDDLRSEWDKHELWMKEHFVLAFFVNVFEFFRYRVPANISEARLAVKWAYQRVVRGYDDPFVWSMYSEHSKMMIAALTKLRNSHVGSPMPDVDDDTIDIHALWESQLDTIIDGFKAMQEMEELTWSDAFNKEKQQELDERFTTGMKLFTKHYRSLWD